MKGATHKMNGNLFETAVRVMNFSGDAIVLDGRWLIGNAYYTASAWTEPTDGRPVCIITPITRVEADHE